MCRCIIQLEHIREVSVHMTEHMYCCRARTRRTYCTTHTALRILYYASIYDWPSFRLSAYILVCICVGSYVKLVYSFKIAQLALPSFKYLLFYYFLSSFPGYLSIAIKSQSNYNTVDCTVKRHTLSQRY